MLRSICNTPTTVFSTLPPDLQVRNRGCCRLQSPNIRLGLRCFAGMETPYRTGKEIVAGQATTQKRRFMLAEVRAFLELAQMRIERAGQSGEVKVPVSS